MQRYDTYLILRVKDFLINFHIFGYLWLFMVVYMFNVCLHIVMFLVLYMQLSLFLKHFLSFEELEVKNRIFFEKSLQVKICDCNFAPAIESRRAHEEITKPLRSTRFNPCNISVTVAGIFVKYRFMHRKLNIPVQLILNVCKDRQNLELLAFRVYLMLVYDNATMYRVTEEKIQEKFKCDRPTAQRLLCEAKRSPWFYYNRNRNSLNARSMKSKGVYVASSGNTYFSDFCYCMDKEYISLNEMVKRLRGIVIMMIISQACWEPSNGASQETGAYALIYQATFAKYLGLSCKSVCRLLQHLSEIGWVRKTKQFFFKLKSMRNATSDEVEKYESEHHKCHLAVRESSRYYGRTKTVDFNYFKCFGLGYCLNDSFSERFRTIMWTHSKRVSAERIEPNKDKRMLVDFPVYYELLFNPNYPAGYVQEHYRVA